VSFTKYKYDLVLAIHFMLGIVSTFNQTFVFIWVLSVFIIGIYKAFVKSVHYPPYLFAGYLIGIELLGRMSGSAVPHEFTKYAVGLLLGISIIRSIGIIYKLYMWYILLLLPAILLTDGGNLEATRQLISANLSGPICLAISVIYFYNRRLTLIDTKKLFIAILFPLAAILGYLVIKTPDFSEIEFGYQSNFVTSVYGPNQMSSMLGLGILIIGLSYLLKMRLFGSHIVALGFVSFLLFRGLLTFSRGGMVTPAILLVLVFLYYTWKVAGFNKNTTRVIFFAIFLSGLAVMLFNYADEITGNKLGDRYAGRKGGKQIEDIDKLTSGRTMITYLDWQIFIDNPMYGAGVGMSKSARAKYGLGVEAAAHNEFSRVLAEHGLFGVVALLILIVIPIQRFFNCRKTLERILMISFIGFCFVFMTHSATRLAAPCFLYGFAFVFIVPNNRKLKFTKIIKNGKYNLNDISTGQRHKVV